MNLRLLVIAALVSLVTRTVGYNILVMFPVPSRSHNLLGKGIVEALVDAGHKVTWGTPYPEKTPMKNVEFIDLSETINLANALDMARTNLAMDSLVRFGTNISLVALENPQLKKMLVERNFDAVVAEWFMTDLLSGLAAVQQIPYIMFSGIIMQPYTENLVDSIRSVPIVPIMILHFPIPMDFSQRVMNNFLMANMALISWKENRFASEKYEAIFSPLAAARGQQLSSLYEASHNVSVLLLNSHPSIAPTHSVPPNVVDIAGFHIGDEVTALPKDIQDILDKSPQGVLYFSMGTVVKTDSFPQKMKDDILKIFKDLPYTILWKLDHAIEGAPKNVHVRNWWPQASILAHPNMKLFITHGGLLSTIEAVHHGVPLLAIPVFGDQPGNAFRAEQAGYAVAVKFSPNIAPEFKMALDELLGNDTYYKQAKHLSKLFRNRLVSPRKTIAHYVELAIESKGAYHLRSNARHYEWYQIWMLDQVAALAAILYILYRLIRLILSFCFSSKKTQSKKVKKN